METIESGMEKLEVLQACSIPLYYFCIVERRLRGRRKIEKEQTKV
ncbi:hypothetical protein [Cytobacillus purgationiresistens]|nr:hypothetical protein [Cytobacillus purgationiresistens]